MSKTVKEKTKKAVSKTKAKSAGRPAGSKNHGGSVRITDAIQELIEKKGTFLHQRDIAPLILRRVKPVKPETFSHTITTILRHLVEQEKIARVQMTASRRSCFYGKKEWLDKKNSPKKEYTNNKMLKVA